MKTVEIIAFDNIEITLKSGNRNREEALSALDVLGFPMKAVHKMIDKLLDETPDMEVEELVKKALKQM